MSVAMQTLVVDAEFQALIPPLQEHERAELERSLLSDGCRDALVAWDGVLLDGHHRYEICQKHGIVFGTVERACRDRDEAKEWIIRNQFARRNLTAFQRSELALQLEPLVAARAKERQRLGGVEKVHQISGEPQTDRQLAAVAGVSHDTLHKAKVLVERATPATLAALRNGEVTINRAYQKLRRGLKAKQAQAALDVAQERVGGAMREDIASVCDLRVCSCAELFASGIKPDAVITDPPYPKEFLPVFSELAGGCVKAGVPLVAVMSGQSYLPEVMERLCKHLLYRWTLAYMTPGGQAVQQWQAKANTAWKPVLLFGEPNEWFGDVAVSRVNDNDKRFHDWGQSESGMADLIERLTQPGQLVCDPFLGGGTTAVVSLALGRRFVGCDVDASCIDKAWARVRAICLP